MHNLSYLIGRLTSNVEREERDGKSVAKITLAVQRSFKNAEGIYETDFIPVILWGGIAENTSEYCQKGDLVGVKGRLEVREKLNGEKEMNVIADKVTFLSSKAQD